MRLRIRHEIQHRDGHAADEEAGDFSGHEGDGEALEDGVGQDDSGSCDDGQGGEEHGAETDGTGINDGFAEGHAFAQALFDEVHEDDGISHHDARTCHKSDHAGGGKERTHGSVGGKDADERKWNGDHDDGGR